MCFEYFEPFQKHVFRFVHFCYDYFTCDDVLLKNGKWPCTTYKFPFAGFRLLCTDMLGTETCS